MEKGKNNHGGARIGAGRKPLEEKKDIVFVRLTKMQLEQINSLIIDKKFNSRSAAIRFIIDNFFKI